MSCRRVLAVLVSFLAIALAWQPPSYSGYTRKWKADFIGPRDSLPDSRNWNIVTGDNNYNNESQTYSSNKLNLRRTSKGTLQLVPRKKVSATKGWTSARIESTYTFTPTAGKITRFESSLRLGGNAALHKQSIWPAFWLLGDSCRKGGIWPACGEVDIMENVNGQKIAYGSVHCDVAPGGICNENTGLTNTTSLLDSKYHVWRVEFNRKSTNYKSQYITWYMDGKQFHRVTGTQISNTTVWKSLCQSPLYTIFNVAVGGYWPGYPNSQTWGGMDSMMEVGYVAHYVST
ncbi:secreted glucosidase [Ilyonectria destructans]|nr:secreted glucosidase [Ilyonectria destructans]